MTKPARTGRLPVDQGGAGRQEMWLAIKQAPEHVTVTAITTATGLNRSTVSRYLKALTAAGHLAFEEPPPGQPGAWKLIRDVGHHAPRVRADGTKVTQGVITLNLWQAMRGLKDFTFQDLIQHSPIEISEHTARDYCKRLLSAGYLKVLKKADPTRAQVARYRLIRQSGPKAPQVQRVRRVYDPNTGAVYMVEGQS